MDSLPRPRKNASLQVSIYEFIERSGGGVGPKEIAEGIGSLAKTVRSTLTVMKNKGLVHTSDHGSYEVGPDPTTNTSRDNPPETIGKLPYSVIVQKGQPVNSPFTSLDDDTNLYEAALRLLLILIPEEDLSMMIQESGGVLDLPLSPMFRNLDGSRKKITLIIRVEEATPERPAQKDAPPANGE